MNINFLEQYSRQNRARNTQFFSFLEEIIMKNDSKIMLKLFTDLKPELQL